MGFEIDASDFDDENDATYEPGSKLLEAGSYHVRIAEVDDRYDTESSVRVTFQAISGTTPDQEGKERRAYFDFSTDDWKLDKAQAQLAQLCLALGLIKPHEKKDVDLVELVDGECIASFTESNKADANGRPYVNYDRCWAIGNPDAPDVPAPAIPDASGEADSLDDL